MLTIFGDLKFLILIFAEAVLERFHSIARILYHQTPKGGGKGPDRDIAVYKKIISAPLHDRFYLDELDKKTWTCVLVEKYKDVNFFNDID